MTDYQPDPTLSVREPDLTSNNPYHVLGVTQLASQAEIKQAYFALIRQYPPETEAETFKIIRAAYEKIRSVARRAETDVFLPQPPPADAAPSQKKPALDTRFYRSDVLLALRRWGDLGRTNFSADYKEIEL